jgi:cbb3-type cytochrome oxidase maturation protein
VSIALLLIPLALVLLAAAIGAFFWAVDSDQFEDLDTVALGMTDDDPPALPPGPAVPPEPPTPAALPAAIDANVPGAAAVAPAVRESLPLGGARP